MKVSLNTVAWAVALAFGVAPLWAGGELPLVDLPQHLHLISVLHRLHDATTLYPQVFEGRGELTPYLGYYYAVSLLNWLVPLEVANKLFLSAYVVGLPLSLAFLLRSLKRPAWPALLALPFAYGDSFGWGFVNFVAALPLAFVTCGCFVRAIADSARRRSWAVALAFALVLVLLFHVQAFAWLGVALPFLLLSTPAPEGKAWQLRVPALLGVVPGVLTFILWVGLRLGQPSEIAPGQPWKSWGPLLSPQNLSWKSFEQNRAEFLPTLAGLLPDQSDRPAVLFAFIAAAALSLVAAALRLSGKLAQEEGAVARFRIVGLAALALILFFALPFDIRGYMYYLNTRYAHLAAALLVCCVPAIAQPRFQQAAVLLAALAGPLTGVPLFQGFRAFGEESRALSVLSQATGPKPRVMGLIYATGSATVTHPVYLHAATVLARARGGLTNFSFALTPHSPLKYRPGQTPPTFPSEWRPDQMRWEEHGAAYDHFVVRGVHPAQIFGPRLGAELEIAARSGDFWLVRRR